MFESKRKKRDAIVSEDELKVLCWICDFKIDLLKFILSILRVPTNGNGLRTMSVAISC